MGYVCIRMYVREYKGKQKSSDRKDNNAPRVLGTQSKHCSGTYKTQSAFKYSLYIVIPQKDPKSMTLTAHFDIHGSAECNYHVRLKIGSTWVGVLLLLLWHLVDSSISHHHAHALLGKPCFRYRLLQYSCHF